MKSKVPDSAFTLPKAGTRRQKPAWPPIDDSARIVRGRPQRLETARTTSLIFAIIAGVLIYVHFLGFTGMPAMVAEWIVGLDISPTVVLICILCLYLVLGMFLDGIGMLLLTVPIILPTIKQLGIDPIVFGVLVVRMVEIGLITPPVGLNVYVLKGVAKGVPMSDMFKGCGWFVLVDLINVAILIAFPSIILLIPSTMIK